MRFAWNRATAEQPATDDPSSSSVTVDELELGAVELQTVDGRRVGWVATEGQRTSDWLNAQADIPVLGLAGDNAELPPEPPRGQLAATAVERDSILWVVPPALPANRHLRLHRRRILVHLELDDYRISGQAHVRPGADAVDQVLRGTRELVPLTEVQVVSASNPGQGFAAPVLVVNRLHVRRLVEDSAHMSGPVPEPVEPLPPDAELDPRIAWLLPDPPVADDLEPAPAAGLSDAAGPPQPTGLDLLRSAAELLLETGVIDVVEFQSIRARISASSAD